VLALVGTLDTATTPEENLPPLREALASGGNERVAIRVLDGINHWLQPATTGNADEIEQIEITIAPAVLDVITDWIHGVAPEAQ